MLTTWILPAFYPLNFREPHSLTRLGKLLREASIPCHAWMLTTSRVHALLKIGLPSVNLMMARLLTGYEDSGEDEGARAWPSHSLPLALLAHRKQLPSIARRGAGG